jgi:hypothetical protein
MRYRALDANGDMTFGQGSENFLVNSPAAVAQLVMTRMKLFRGEWFLDVTEGMPWSQEVLGKQPQATYDLAIRDHILDTQGVLEIVSYSSTRNPDTRALTVTVVLDTIYGITQPTQVL